MNRKKFKPLFVVLLAVLASVPVRRAAHAEQDPEQRAVAFFQSGQYRKALEAFTGLYAATQHPTYLRNIGRCYQFLREPEKAINNFREYLRQANNLAPGKRAQVETFIREMEDLKTQEARGAAASDAPLPPAEPEPTPQARVPPAPPISIAQTQLPPRAPVAVPSAEPLEVEPLGTETSSGATVGAFVRVDIGVQHPGTVLLPGLALRFVERVEITAAAFIGHYKGVCPGVAYFFLDGDIKPEVSLRVPIIFAVAAADTDSRKTIAGVQGGAGLTWDMTRWLSASFELTGVYFPGAAAGLGAAWLVPSLALQGRM